MGRVTFASTVEARIVATSFPRDSFGTVGIRTGDNLLEILALDDNLSTAAKLELQANAFSSFDISGQYLLSVETKAFKSHLMRAVSGYYEGSEVSVSLLFQRKSLGVLIDVEGRNRIRRTLQDIPSGTKELPKLPERNGDAEYSSADCSLLRQVYDAFRDSNEIHLQIRRGEMTFKIPPFTENDSFRVLSGDCQGEAQSTILRSCLNTASKVHALPGLERLRISMEDQGLSRFEYEFGSCRLVYWVVPTVP